MLSILLAACLSVLIHELGHAGTQALFGIPVTEIRLGTGPVLFRIGVLQVRLMPFSGSVSPAGSSYAQTRWKGVLIALSGVLAQWAMFALLVVMQIDSKASWRTFFDFYLIFACCALLEWVPTGDRDGFHAWMVLRRKGLCGAEKHTNERNDEK